MKVIADSDFIIKITKVGIKTNICNKIDLFISPVVKFETVDEGKKKNCDDAIEIEKNIENRRFKLIKVHKSKATKGQLKGELEIIFLFSNGEFDAIASDDTKFLKKLEKFGLPFFTPATIIIFLYKKEKFSKKDALKFLNRLKDFISEDEFFTSLLYIQKEEKL